jgi:hypothetical protein
VRSGPSASPFVTTPYFVSETGVAAVVPARGPCWRDETPCAIGLHHKRRRKTGPPWGWVAVMLCAVHAHAFTVYPAGHVPYGREPFVALAPDGSEVRSSEPGGFLSAAAAARKGNRWPRDGATAPDAVRTTQRRRVQEAATLLGLAAGATTPAVAAAVLHLPEGRLVETERRLSESRDLATWGREVSDLVCVLARRGGRWLMDRFAVLGHLAGWWGKPWRWVQRVGRLLALGEVFWPGTRGRAPP